MLDETKRKRDEITDKVHKIVVDILMSDIKEIVRAMPVHTFKKLQEAQKKGDRNVLATYSAVACVVIQNLIEDGKLILRQVDKEK